MMLSMIVLPLALGVSLSAALCMSRHAWLHSSAIAAGFLLVGVIISGLPPFPPISSKQKIIYLLAVICVAAPVVSGRGQLIRLVTAGLIICGAFLWLNWRRLSADMPIEPLLLSLSVLVVWLVGVVQAERSKTGRFLWLSAVFAALLTASPVGLLSGYLGLGQLSGGFAAYLGGVLLIPYASLLLAFPNGAQMFAASTAWVGLTAIGVLAVSLASLATNLHPLAFGLLLLTLLSPLIVVRLPIAQPSHLQPIVVVALAAMPAGGAILTSYLYF